MTASSPSPRSSSSYSAASAIARRPIPAKPASLASPSARRAWNDARLHMLCRSLRKRWRNARICASRNSANADAASGVQPGPPGCTAANGPSAASAAVPAERDGCTGRGSWNALMDTIHVGVGSVCRCAAKARAGDASAVEGRPARLAAAYARRAAAFSRSWLRHHPCPSLPWLLNPPVPARLAATSARGAGRGGSVRASHRPGS